MNTNTLLDIIPCSRCAYPCRVVHSAAPESQPFPPTVRFSQSRHGICLECAVHWQMFMVDGFRWAFENDNGLLYEPVMQDAIGSVLAIGSPDIDPAKINWKRLLNQWNMAWPKDWALPTNEHDVEHIANRIAKRHGKHTPKRRRR